MVNKVKLGDLFEIKAGGTPSRSRADYFDGGIPWVKISDMLQGVITFTEETISTKGLENSGVKLLPKGTILISIFATVGRTAELAIDATTNQAIVGLVPKHKGFDKKFIRYYLDYKAQSLKDLSRGVAQNNINKSILSNIELTIPLLQTQQKIASILAQADATRNKRKEANKLTEAFLQSVFLEMFGDPVRNEKGWEVVLIDKFVDKIISGWSAESEQRPSKGNEMGVLKVSSVTYGVFKPEENKVVINIPINKVLVNPMKNDVLMTRANTREMVAACCIVDANYKNLFLSDKHWKVVLKSDLIKSVYFRFVIMNKSFHELLANKSTGTSGSMFNISKDKLLETSFPLPPLSLQEKFTSLVESVEQLRNKQSECESGLEALFDSLMNRYFG